MVSQVTSLNLYSSSSHVTLEQVQRLLPQKSVTNPLQDTLDIGNNGVLSTGQSMEVVLERSLARLRAVVDDARAQLGIPEDAVLDTSPEATANRIADFALGFFETWLENDEARGLLDTEEARRQFADFIAGPISQGIAEARDILTALNALNGEVDSSISSIEELISQRLEDFVLNG